MTNDQYLEAFINNLQVLSHSGVKLGRNKALRKVIFKNLELIQLLQDQLRLQPLIKQLTTVSRQPLFCAV